MLDNMSADQPPLIPDPIVTLPDLSDDRGGLVSIEGERSVPFPIARVYFIYGTQAGVERGFHAHVALRQLAVCVSGRCEMILDDGRERRSYVLDHPTKGVLIQAMTWREMRAFSPDAVLMVLADAYYDETDYIRSYDDFLARLGDHG